MVCSVLLIYFVNNQTSTFPAGAGFLAIPASVFAADDSKAAAGKPIILESGLAYVDKKKNDGLLSSVEQKVGEV